MDKSVAIKHEVRYLTDLVTQVYNGTLCVLKFRRDFMWNDTQMLSLLDSMYRGYPIGSIYIWDTRKKFDSLESVGDVRVEPREHSYILHGHQRLATLLNTLMCDEVSETRAYFDLEGENFVYLQEDEVTSHHFAMLGILETTAYLKERARIEAVNVTKFIPEIDMLVNAFHSFKIPVVRIRNAGMKTVLEILKRLGVKQ